MNAFSSAIVQRKRIFNFLHICTSGTQTVRKQSAGITAIEINESSRREELHGVKCYVLVAGAVAPTPADKVDGIHRQETDKSENSMEGGL